MDGTANISINDLDALRAVKAELDALKNGVEGFSKYVTSISQHKTFGKEVDTLRLLVYKYNETKPEHRFNFNDTVKNRL